MDQTSQTPQPSIEHDQAQEKATIPKVYWIAGIVIVAGGLLWYVASPKASSTTGTDPQPVAQTAFVAYKDGTYTADGDYVTHVGPERITVTLTLKDDIITDSEFSSTPNARESSFYQGMFSKNYKQYVVGKNINEVHLTRVSGSSLTPIGFNSALEKIKAQAAA